MPVCTRGNQRSCGERGRKSPVRLDCSSSRVTPGFILKNVLGEAMATSDLTIHQVRVFEAVVLHGSIYRAAIALDLPQPSVSRVLGRLETSLGTRLLMRAVA